MDLSPWFICVWHFGCKILIVLERCISNDYHCHAPFDAVLCIICTGTLLDGEGNPFRGASIPGIGGSWACWGKGVEVILPKLDCAGSDGEAMTGAIGGPC